MAASAPVRGTTSGATWSSGARSSRKRAAVVAAVAVLGAAGLLGGVAALASLFGGATSSSNAGATAAPGVVSSPAASRSAAAPTPAGVGVELAAGTIEVAGIPVSVGALEADRFEATVADWDECAAAGKCRGSVDDVSLPGLEPREAAFWTSFCTHADRNQRKRHPLNCVSASQARDYCTWRGRRLPTLPEWGYVAYGAGSAAPRRYPWGGAEPTGKHLNACGLECVAHVRPPGASAQPPFLPGFDDGARDTAAAGSYPAGNTPSGVSDMAGNVWEWTATEASDAKGQVTIAGGGWYDRDPARMTLAGTRSLAAEARHASVGFRCVR
jgi:formylglycine-generating enzyme required for sulfatase activity